MMANLRLISTEIIEYIENLNGEYSRVKMIKIRNACLSIIRILDKELGYPLTEVIASEKVDSQRIDCKYCNYSSEKGLASIKSHHGIKHKNEAKQW